jgi:deazaflavin-dependent oxidoreductase (nitroreductase family)
LNPILRRGMIAANGLFVRIYRASGGKIAGSAKGTPVLLLTVRGRKTGAPHTTPVGYLQDAGRWIVTGSANGMADEPQWFRNLRAAGDATIQIGDVTRQVAIAVPEGEQRDALWRQFIAANPPFASYEKKTTRQIPVAVLTERLGG